MDAEAIREIFSGLGPVHIRRMFGGQGVYQDDLMFALEEAGELYLKADEESISLLEERGSHPFSYETRNGRTTITSFWRMPESALDDLDEATELARMALAAARRSKGRKAPPAKKARKRPIGAAT